MSYDIDEYRKRRRKEIPNKANKKTCINLKKFNATTLSLSLSFSFQEDGSTPTAIVTDKVQGLYKAIYEWDDPALL